MSNYNKSLLLALITSFILMFVAMYGESSHPLETRNDALVIQNVTNASAEALTELIANGKAKQNLSEESIMIPVRLAQASDGSWQWHNSLEVDEVDCVLMMILSPEGSNWKVTVTKEEGSDVLLDEQPIQDKVDPASNFGNRYLSL